MTEDSINPTTVSVTKLVTITEHYGQEVNAEIRQEHFKEFDQETMSKIVGNLLQVAGEQISKESEVIASDELLKTEKTPLNAGSLYDELVFEASIYASGEGAIVVNTTFGRLADPENLITYSLDHVAEVFQFLSEQFHNGEVNLRTETLQ